MTRVFAGVVSTATVLLLSAGPAFADTIDVKPTWDGAPGQEKIQRILNVTAQAGLTCCILSLLVGGATLGIGKLMGSTQSGVRAGQLIFGGGGGALVITFAAKIVTWLIA